MRENTSVHRLLRRVLSLCLAVVLAVSLCVPALAAQKSYSASDYVQAEGLRPRQRHGGPGRRKGPQ